MGTPHSALHVVYDDLNALFVREAEKGIRCSPEIAMLKTLGTALTAKRGQWIWCGGLTPGAIGRLGLRNGHRPLRSLGGVIAAALEPVSPLSSNGEPWIEAQPSAGCLHRPAVALARLRVDRIRVDDARLRGWRTNGKSSPIAGDLTEAKRLIHA